MAHGRSRPFAPLQIVSSQEYNFPHWSMLPRMSIHVKGTTGLVIAAVIMIAVLIGFPAYRIFLGISLGIGIVVALLLHLRNKYRPIQDKDVDNKRPLGLD
jgi:hypothetical protein